MEFASSQPYTTIFLIGAIVVLIAFYVRWKTEKNSEKKIFWIRAQKKRCVLNTYKSMLSLLMLSVMLVIFAGLRPSWGDKTESVNEEGSDVIFVLDISNSMKALDMSVSHRPLDRLTAAKIIISDFVSEHPENRYGLVLFAGESFVSSPLTFDTTAFNTFLNSADTNDISTQGTDISKAISLAINRFSNTKSKDDEERGKMIVLISDGGEKTPEDMPLLIEQAKNKGVRIVTLGVGGDKGVPIPESEDFFGNIQYKRHNGKIIYTTLNEKPLQEIANGTNGTYMHLKSGKDIERVANILKKQKTTIIEHGKETTKKERYEIFLLIALALFIIYTITPLLCSLTKKIKKQHENS